MADRPIVHMGENSPEEVAYKLMNLVANMERKALHGNPEGSSYAVAGRQWLLDTYAECLDATLGRRVVKSR